MQCGRRRDDALRAYLEQGKLFSALRVRAQFALETQFVARISDVHFKLLVAL